VDEQHGGKPAKEEKHGSDSRTWGVAAAVVGDWA
jgi:hypothetical protein